LTGNLVPAGGLFSDRRMAMRKDPDENREREFDAITFLLAAVLTAIILGAVGYGVVNSSRVAMPLPPQPGTTGSR
jgi:hypothetical protein